MAESIQRISWGIPDIEIIPKDLMIALSNYSLQLGAFTPEDRLISLVLTYLTKPQQYLMHALCTAPEFRGVGASKLITSALFEQLAYLQANRLHWTFDPFEFVNAHLYLNVLKGRAYRCEKNYYGFTAANEHKGIPTHRLFCEIHFYQTLQPLHFEERLEIRSLSLIDPMHRIEYMNLIFNQIQEHLLCGLFVTGFDWDKKSTTGYLRFSGTQES